MPLTADALDSTCDDWNLSDEGPVYAPVRFGPKYRGIANPGKKGNRAGRGRVTPVFMPGATPQGFANLPQAGSESAGFGKRGGMILFDEARGFNTDHLNPGESLRPGQMLKTSHGETFAFQTDANLVVYDSNHVVLFASDTDGSGAVRLTMQTDGNLVLYTPQNTSSWESGTNGNPGARLVLQTDGNLVVYQGSRALWSSRDAKKSSLVGKITHAVGGAVGGAVKSVAATGARLVTSPAHLVSDIARGKNVLSSVKDAVKRDLATAKTIAPYAQAVLSVVPVAGQGVNAAIAAGAALAQGQPITDALVAGVKGMVPGGPLAQQALETAYNVAKGQNITDAVANGLRSRLPNNPFARAAFDTGLALAHGQNIQQAAVGAVKDQAMPNLNSLVSTLSPYASRALSNVGPMIASVAPSSSSIVSLLPTSAKSVADALMKNPSLRSLPIADLARKMNVPETLARDGMASLVNAVAKAGGSKIPALSPSPSLASMLSGKTSFDQAIARHASHVAHIALSPNAKIAVRKVRREVRWHKGANNRLAQVTLTTNAQGFSDAGAFAGTLKRGLMRNQEVSNLQSALIGVGNGPAANALASSLAKDATGWGDFGPLTESAVKEFQSGHGLSADGVAGPATNAALDAELQKQGFGASPGPTPSTAPVTPPVSQPMPNPIAVQAAQAKKNPPPTVATPAATPAPSPQVATVATYLVTAKDTRGLYGIAQDYTGNGNRWKELAAVNPQITPPNYVIHAGDVLNLPPSWGMTPATPTAQPTSTPSVGAPAGVPVSATTSTTVPSVVAPPISAPVAPTPGATASEPAKAGLPPVAALGLLGAALAATQMKIF